MKHSSRQFGDKFSGFGRQSKKFSRIGACIRRNFTPCDLKYLGEIVILGCTFTCFLLCVVCEIHILSMLTNDGEK